VHHAEAAERLPSVDDREHPAGRGHFGAESAEIHRSLPSSHGQNGSWHVAVACGKLGTLLAFC
jgi:hypothetical protein